MTPDQSLAFIKLQVILTQVQADLLAMQAENDQRKACEQSMAYREDSFRGAAYVFAEAPFTTLMKCLNDHG